MSSWEFGWEEEEGEGSWQKVAEMNEHFIDYLTNKKACWNKVRCLFYWGFKLLCVHQQL